MRCIGRLPLTMDVSLYRSSETMATNHQPSVPSKNSKGSATDLLHDEIVKEIHAQRAAISERFDGDMAAIIRYCQSFHPPIPVSKAKPQLRCSPVAK